MQQLSDLIGAERAPAILARALHDSVRETGARVTGAALVTCADEAEAECAYAFEEAFTRQALPPLKFGRSAPFRLATLGGHYQFGAIHVAAHHFALAGRPEDRKLMIAKVSGHTGCTLRDDGPHYGILERYGKEDACCGALDVLLGGGKLSTPYVEEAMGSEGKDRLAILRDPEQVDPRERGLRAALASARIQARKVAMDVQDLPDSDEFLWLVAACATINREGRDTEILGGFYCSKGGAPSSELEYEGLGDDPAAYVLAERNRQLLVTDSNGQARRSARDHRQMIGVRSAEIAPEIARQRDARLEETRRAMGQDQHRHGGHNGVLLSSLLLALGEVAPVPAAMLLFARGIAGVQHTWRVHRIAKDMSRSEDAREVLRDVRQRIDQLDPAQREAAIELLMAQHG